MWKKPEECTNLVAPKPEKKRNTKLEKKGRSLIVARIGKPLPVVKGGKKVSLVRNHSKKLAKLAEKARR